MSTDVETKGIGATCYQEFCLLEPPFTVCDICKDMTHTEVVVFCYLFGSISVKFLFSYVRVVCG
jgi:hypothetical protein